MPATYEPIATTTLGSAASSITFSSIPGTYTDLRLVLFHLSASTNTYPYLCFNNDSATNYSYTELRGNGTAASSLRHAAQSELFIDPSYGSSSTIPGLCTADIFSYSGSTFKTVLITTQADRNGSGGVERIVGLWRSTAALTSILVTVAGADFAAGTTATLYGIKRA